ncbi:hypothetical protein AB0A69_12080 [Streptomyces sp. NPDC045431]|uniref:hypothetical protein n=1 Tax=Streptomyces sp. NPDC045431 TaxID=3155613 RepID=UPI0033EAD4E1
MRSTLVRRTAVAATAVSLAVLATACSGSAEKGGDAGQKGDKGKASAPAEAAEASGAKAPSSAELEKLALVEGDVQLHEVKSATAAEKITAAEITTDKPECLAVAHAVAGVAQGQPVGTTEARRVTEKPEKNKKAVEGGDIMAAFNLTTTQVVLGSYDGKGAEGAFAALRKAAADCAGGFTTTWKGEQSKVAKVTELKAAGGDEAAAWGVALEQDGETVTYKITAVRKGAVIGSFSSFNLISAQGKDFPLPTAVIEAQVAKLG